MAERFVKTMKEDYIAFTQKTDARVVLENQAAAFERCNKKSPSEVV